MEKPLHRIFPHSSPLPWKKPGRALLLVFLLYTGIGAYAQKEGTDLIDSLKTELTIVKSDTAKVNILNELSEHAGWRINENDTSLEYARQALDLATKANFKNGMAMSLENMGIAYSQSYDYQEALKKYSTALELYKETENKRREGLINKNIGNVYQELGDYDKAIEYLTVSEELRREADDQAIIAEALYELANTHSTLGNYPEALEQFDSVLELYKEMGDKEGEARTYLAVGWIFATKGDYPEAQKQSYIALKISEEIGDKSLIADSYIRIGYIQLMQEEYAEALSSSWYALDLFKEIGSKSGQAKIYNFIGYTYYQQREYSLALENCSSALKLYEEIGDQQEIAYVYVHMGRIHEERGDYQAALKVYFDAVKPLEKKGDKYNIAGVYGSIGDVYVKLNQPREAKTWLEKSLRISREVGVKETTKVNYASLSKADSALHNWKGAYENYKLYTIYKDSIYNEENIKKLTQVEMQYEFDKKEALTKAEQEKKDFLAREALTKAKNNRNLALTGVGIFMLVAAFSGIGYRQNRRSNKIISREKQKSDDLLLNILPQEVAEELKTTGASEAKYFESVSIMFTDFKDFTKQSEKISPKELIRELNYCFKAFDEIITKHGIEKIKTIGDAYLAVCGLPVPQENHAKTMMEAAFEIRDFMENYKRKRVQEGKSFFEMRIGINSGEVVAGIVGIKKFAYDIWGDAVNIAARMESNGEVGKVNISESTYNQVKDDFECEYRGEIQAKGKGKINMYFAEPKSRI